MAVLFVFIAVGIVFFGYFIMSRLDAFFQNGGFVDNPPVKIERSLVVFCVKHAELLLGKLEPSLQQYGFRCCLISEPHVPVPVSIMAVLALSDNDLDNLLLCHEAKHLCADVYTIALCSDQLFRHYFHDAGIDQVLMGQQSVDSLITLINERILTFSQQKQSVQDTREK
jgi:hypothetical protein